MVCVEYYTAIENEIQPFAAKYTEVEDIMSEICQTQKHKYCILSLLCGS